MRPSVAIFACNLLHSLRRLLDSLSAYPEFAGTDLTIFIDGPRYEVEAALVAKTRQVAETATPAALKARFTRESRKSAPAAVTPVS